MKRRKLDGLLDRLDAAAASGPPLSPDDRRELERLRGVRTRLRAALRPAEGGGLQPFFAERVLRRLAAPAVPPEEALARSLAWVFRRVALAGLLVLLGLTCYNLAAGSHYGTRRSVVEAALSLPPLTLETAYELDLPAEPVTEQDLRPTP